MKVVQWTSRPPTPKFCHFFGFDTYNFVYNIQNTQPIKIIIGTSVACDVIDNIHVLFFTKIVYNNFLT